MIPGDRRIVPGIRLERLRSTPVWTPALPSRFIKPASAPAAVVGRIKFAGGVAISNTNTLDAFNALSAQGRPSTFGSATTAGMYTHRREHTVAGFHPPGGLAVGGEDSVGPNKPEGGARGLSFKLWSEGRGNEGGRSGGGGGGAPMATTTNRRENGEDDQSSLGTLVGEACRATSCNAGHFTASTSPALASFDGKDGAGVTVKTKVAAPTSDFGVTAAVSQLGVGTGGVGSKMSDAASAVAAFIETDRPVDRLSCTLVQLSTRCVCAD